MEEEIRRQLAEGTTPAAIIRRLVDDEGFLEVEARDLVRRAEAAAAYQMGQGAAPRRIGATDLSWLSTTPRPSPPSGPPRSAPPPASAWSDTAPPSAECRCGGAGYYVADARYGEAGFGQLVPCGCTLARQSTRRAARAQGLLDQLHAELGRLRHCTLESFDPARPLRPYEEGGGTRWLPDAQRETLLAALDVALAYAEAPAGWLYLHGPVGAGKSHLAAGIANAVCARGLRAAYATAAGLIIFLKAGFADGSADRRLVALQQVDLLVIDDLGTQRASLPGEWAFEQFYELLNSRYLQERPTVLTSNLPPDHLEERLRDRVTGMAVEVRMVASSYRQIRLHGS